MTVPVEDTADVLVADPDSGAWGRDVFVAQELLEGRRLDHELSGGWKDHRDSASIRRRLGR